MRLALALCGFFVAAVLCLGQALAADSDWLIGHWDGHNTKKASDTRHFAFDIASVNADQSFAAQWGVDDKQTSGQGKIDNNAVTITFANGNTVSLFRASDGSLAGSVENKDGSPGATLVFAKGGATTAIAAPQPSGNGRSCSYRPVGAGTAGQRLLAKDGDQVVARLGIFRCVDGKLQRVN